MPLSHGLAFSSFSKAQAILVLLTLTTFAVSIAVIVLSGHGITSYLQSNSLGPGAFVDIAVEHYPPTALKPTQYLTQVAFWLPNGKPLSNMYGLLMAGILGTLLAFVILVATLREGDGAVNVSLSGRKVRTIRFLGSITVLLLDAALLVTFVVVACYSWTAGDRYFEFDNHMITLPITPDIKQFYRGKGFTYEQWTCELATLTADGATSPSRGQLSSLCGEARMARYLALALLCLAFTRLLVHFWAWRRHNIGMRQATAQTYDLGEASAYRKDSQGSQHSSERQYLHKDKGANDGVAELPNRMSVVEAPDFAVCEMPGDSGSREPWRESYAHGEDVIREKE